MIRLCSASCPLRTEDYIPVSHSRCLLHSNESRTNKTTTRISRLASRYTHDLLEVLLRGSESESAIFVSPPTKVSGFCENATEPTKQSKVLGGQFELCFTMSAGSVHSAAASAAAAAGTAKRTFSKNELYAPLQVSAAMKMSKGSSHHNRIDDGGSMLSKVPASIREQSYIKFLCQVSERYHRLSTARAAKKNGDRPMGSADIDPLIQHRSLSLFGGGIHKAIMGKATEPAEAVCPTEKKKPATTTTMVTWIVQHIYCSESDGLVESHDRTNGIMEHCRAA